MSRNWTMNDLVRRLRTVQVRVDNVQVGDVIIGEFGPDHVARIAKRRGGMYEFYDEDDNSDGGRVADRIVTILDRAIFRQGTK